MKLLMKVAALPLLSLAFSVVTANAGERDLSITCGDESSTRHSEDGHCREGMVTFRGSSFPENVGVKVLSYPAGTLIDSATYSTSEGNLRFTQTLVPAGTYMVVVTENNEG